MKKIFPFLLLLCALLSITPAHAVSSFVYQTNTVNSGSAVKVPVVVATTTSITLSGAQTIDGIQVSDHIGDASGKVPDRVLVKNQTDPTTNGIYTVSSSGAWQRAPDFQGINNVVSGTIILVNSGTQAGFWTLTSDDPVVIGSNGLSPFVPSNIVFDATQIPVPQNLALPSGQIFVGNAMGNAAAMPISGDCALSDTGVVTCTETNGAPFTSAATTAAINGLCMVASGGVWQAGSCTGPSGSGTVTTGVSGQLAYYGANNNVVLGTSTIPSGITAVTQSAGDMSAKIATNAFVNTTALTLANGTTATTQATNDNTTKVATDAFVLANAATSGLPTGATIIWPVNPCPTGTQEENGDAISRTTFANLFVVIGTSYGAGDGSTTYNLPDLRGEFVRGWDDGAGVDPGRALGSTQQDAFQGHHHTTNATFTNVALAGGGSVVDGGNPVATVGDPITDGVNGTPRTAAETRPKNVAMTFCIKN